MTELTASNVEEIFANCLFTDDEVKEIGAQHLSAEEVLEMDDPPFKVAQGIIHDVAFHPGRLEESREKVESMLAQLEDSFMITKGGGMSFLNMCMRADGEQWTGLHQTQEQLATLGIALDVAAWAGPREIWRIFPGGMPYLVVKDNQFHERA